jgi:hypothetical protein
MRLLHIFLDLFPQVSNNENVFQRKCLFQALECMQHMIQQPFIGEANQRFGLIPG